MHAHTTDARVMSVARTSGNQALLILFCAVPPSQRVPCAFFCVGLLVMRKVQEVAMLMKHDCTGLPSSIESGCCTSVLGC